MVAEKDKMLNTENDNSIKIDKKLKETTNTSNVNIIRKTYQQRSEKRKFKDMFNRLLFPIELQMQFDTHPTRIQLDQIESVDSDSRFDSVEDSIFLGLVQPNETINDIEYWIWKVAGIGKDLSDRLLKIYFAYIHPGTPVINKTLFLEEYRRIRPTLPFPTLLLSMYLASIKYITTCEKIDGANSLNNGEPWKFNENLAEQLTARILKYQRKRYLPTLASLQSIVIGQMHFFSSKKWSKDWILCFNGVQMCYDLGLNRSSEKLDISQKEKETRRRVWWSLYALDRWLAAESGRPFTIVDDEYTEEYPSENVDLDEVMDSMTENDQHLPRFPSLDEETANKCKSKTIPLYQPLIQMIKLSRILGTILQNMYTPQAKKYYAEHGSDSIVACVDNVLSNWRAGLPPLLEISSVDKISTDNKNSLFSMRGLISLSYYTVLILLHRPFIGKETDNERSTISSQTSLAICTSAANRIIEISDHMSYRDFLLISWNYAIYPPITATYIHLFNAQSADEATVKDSKSKIIQGIIIINKLNAISAGRDELKILKDHVLCSKLFVQDSEFDERLRSLEDTGVLSFSKKKRKITGQKTTQTLNKSDHRSKKDKLPKEHTSSVSSEEYNWLDELRIPINQSTTILDYSISSNTIRSDAIQQDLTNMEDLYSIRQFGFNTPWFNSEFHQNQQALYYSNTYPENPSTNTNQHTQPAIFNSFNSFPYNLALNNMDSIADFDLNNIANYNSPVAPLTFQDSESTAGNYFWGIPNSINADDLYLNLLQTGLQ
ncbi:unnamed protein product [Rhizopus stolonifer]